MEIISKTNTKPVHWRSFDNALYQFKLYGLTLLNCLFKTKTKMTLKT